MLKYLSTISGMILFAYFAIIGPSYAAHDIHVATPNYSQIYHLSSSEVLL
jgi:hypothetical protein